MISKRTAFLFLLLGMILLRGLPQSHAGVFNLPHFVTSGQFAIGVEPELLMTGTASLGVDLKYTHGVSELSNLTGIIGTGGGSRQFRFGGAYTFDFFPDIEKQ